MNRFYILFISLLVSCASEQEQEVFNVIGDYFESKVTHTKGFSSELGKSNVSYINLNIKGGPYINTIRPKVMAAYAATLLYTNLGDEAANKYTNIIISLFENETQKNPIYTQSYTIETIRNIAVLSAQFQEAEQILMHDSSSKLYDLLEEKYKSQEEKERFVSVIEKMKIDRSGVTSVKLLGVELLINSDTKERFLSFSGHVEWGNNLHTEISVRTAEDPNNKSIIHLNIK
ncbi:hypothetical protein [Winogradskyella psychrotolerans]|uniref:hypothetical protein n=1 Tax=Winogradskyella psychrotolerans TaxID=1344585 RepID=UPI001C074AA2|nr:hypothetical protein [Winogradskyella psychrotolerans]MBU2926984.1 hypothetical protein [Winogradskyella psychrotolerans]